jgi:hypothetical protein
MNMPGLHSVAFEDSTNVFACGFETIYQSTDGGIDWTDAGYTGTDVFNSIYAGHGKVFAVGENGQMVLASTTPSSVGSTRLPSNGCSIYPNPMTESATIVFPDDGNYEVILTNMLGEVVRRFQTNSSPVSIERNGLASGLYQVQVRNTRTNLPSINKLIIR